MLKVFVKFLMISLLFPGEAVLNAKHVLSCGITHKNENTLTNPGSMSSNNCTDLTAT